jgi:chemotaxis protein methyltransferase CheR
MGHRAQSENSAIPVASNHAKRPINLSPLLLSCLSTFIENSMGLHFPEERIRDLERGIYTAMRDFGFEDAESCIKWLLSSPLSHSQIETLASHLTVGETYFFRDRRSFDMVEAHILPELIQSRRGREQRLRIWSAGCSTGEEAYSIAIALCKNIPDIKDWNITILATDINPHSLKKASGGVYGEWSFRNAPQWLKERYFRKTNAGHEILPNIKKMVSFSYHNLAEDPYPSLLNNTTAIDIIFCRNVMMYLSRECAQAVVQNLHRCLVENGWLIIGPVDASVLALSLFQTINFPGATMYKKTGAREQRTEVSKETKKIERIESEKGRIGEPAKRGAGAPVTNLEKVDAPLPRFSASPVPTSPVPDLCLEARILANEGKLDDALECCERAISAERLNPSLYYLHATILQEMGRLDEAVSSLKRTLYLDNKFALAHFTMGHLLQQQGRGRESEKHFDNACVLLNLCKDDDILPESDGISAGRLLEIIKAMK